MTPAGLAAVGAALYGPLWQTELARQLGVNDRTVRRWLAGASPVPAGVVDDLRPLLAAAAQRLACAAAVLDGAGRR